MQAMVMKHVIPCEVKCTPKNLTWRRRGDTQTAAGTREMVGVQVSQHSTQKPSERVKDSLIIQFGRVNAGVTSRWVDEKARTA